jgi:chitin synthase
MRLKFQKYMVALFLFCINIIFSSTFVIYEDNWYAYIFILAMASFVNAFSVLCVIGHKIISNDKDNNRITPKNYLYVVPCYNETEEELTNSLNSLTQQRSVNNDKRTILIICDGTVHGKGNEMTTDNILKKILNINKLADFFDYTTWDNNKNIIKIHRGIYNYLSESINFILIIKNINYGKRDSLVLARKICYNYNQITIKSIDVEFKNLETNTENLFKYMNKVLKKIYDNSSIDFIIGIDADTIFDYNCSYELINSIEKDKQIHGSVGYIDIIPTQNMYSPFILYQYGEYMFSQCLRRYTQSNITKKVSCLSGCNQILRVSKETCGNDILSIFNRLPDENENIFNHIRSYASEDRNHVCHMLSMYPNIKTTQTLKAIAYTSVPTSIEVFMSQRRRWNLGAISNDMMLTHLPGINIFERISAGVNTITYGLSPFIFIATIYFLKAIFQNPSMLMLYLSILIFIPLIYAFLIPIFIRPLSFRDSIYYYISFLFYLTFGCIVNLLTYTYSISCMDVIKWGKTRAIDSGVKNTGANETKVNIMIREKNNKDDDYIYINEASVDSDKFSNNSSENNSLDFDFDNYQDTIIGKNVENIIITTLDDTYCEITIN